jgi:hypothetical protein
MKSGEHGGWARVHKSIIESGLDDGCFRFYVCVVRASGPGQAWRVTGAADIGDLIGMQPRTLLTHAEHLAGMGLIEFAREGLGKYVFRLLHNPAEGLFNENASVPAPKAHRRKTSSYASSPVPRRSREGQARSPRENSRDQRGSAAAERPATIAGQPKSAEKYGGLDALSARATLAEHPPRPDSPPYFWDLPLGEVGACRWCGATAVMTDAEGPLCRSCRRVFWAELARQPLAPTGSIGNGQFHS